ncbi:MAG: aquaporin [Bdellovibrionota bacterium]|nr:aquaporin [Bdellovibrionota bacterium]
MKVKHVFPQYISEFIGTFFLIFFGCGSMILAEVNPNYAGSFVPIIWGGSVSIMIYALGHISGAHFNPAVTIAFWSVRRFPGKRVGGYLLAQALGAILASSFHFLIWGASHQFGATEFSISMGVGFLVEVILSFALMFVIISVATDSRAVGELAGIAIGSTVALCAFVGGPLTNASMNPARSLGPALFSGGILEVWPYFLAPVLGTLMGAKVYEWIRCQKDQESDGPGCC